MPRWPEKGRVVEIHQTESGAWSAVIECPDGKRRRFKTAKEPVVIEYVKRYRRRPVKTRFDILTRDNYTCRYCGAKAPDVVLVVDHIVPIANGGTDEPANLVTACEPCNSGKNSRHSGAVPDADVDLVTPRLEVHRRALELAFAPLMAAEVAADE